MRKPMKSHTHSTPRRGAGPKVVVGSTSTVSTGQKRGKMPRRNKSK